MKVVTWQATLPPLTEDVPRRRRRLAYSCASPQSRSLSPKQRTEEELQSPLLLLPKRDPDNYRPRRRRQFEASDTEERGVRSTWLSAERSEAEPSCLTASFASRVRG